MNNTKLRQLLGLPNENRNVHRELIATTPRDFEKLAISDLYGSIGLIAESSEPVPLTHIAALGVIGGGRLFACGYVALYRLSELFDLAKSRGERVEKFGYPHFTAFVEDFVGPETPGRTTIFDKVSDIRKWRKHGADWDTVKGLLSNTPMAGRDAIRLISEPHNTNPITVDHDTGEIVEPELVVDGVPFSDYLKSLTAMGPGEARRDVREKAGLPERYFKEAVYLPLVGLLIHAVWDNKDVDLSVPGIDYGVAQWLCEKLGVRMQYADQDG